MWRSVALVFIMMTLSAYCSSVIPLHSNKGKKLLEEASVKNAKMIKFHQNQTNPKYCGLASLADLINGIGVGYRIKYQNHDLSVAQIMSMNTQQVPILVNETDVLKYLRTNNWKDEDDVNSKGLTLLQLMNAASLLQLGVAAEFTYNQGDISNDTRRRMLENMERESSVSKIGSLEDFRSKLLERISSFFVRGVIVNFHMATLGYEQKFGHFSPMGGYNAQNDMFLLLDVWPDHPSVWIKTELLWQAMLVVDKDSGLPRGFIFAHELLY